MLISNAYDPSIDDESSDLEPEDSYPESYAHSASLPDGTVAELIRDPESPGYTLFACYKDGAISYVDELSTEDEDTLPMPLRRTLKPLRLPYRAEPAGSLKELVFSITDLIQRCVAISKYQALILAHFVVSTWIVDRLPIAPYVAVVGLPQTGKTTLLRVLALVCRRALLSSDLSVQALCHVCDIIQPTLILDDVPHSLCRILRAGNTRNTPVFRGSQSWDLFGPKALAWTSLPDDYALNSRCLIFSMDEAQDTSQLIRPDAPEVIAAADDIQAKLLYFRLETLARGNGAIEAEHLPQPNMEDQDSKTPESTHTLRPRMRDLYQALATPFANDPDQCRLLEKWMSRADIAHREPLPPEESAVLAALYGVAHQEKQPERPCITDLTHLVNLRLAATHERLRIKPRRIGSVLSSFGISQRCRTSRGWAIWLELDDRKKIHQLADRYGLDRSDFEIETFSKCSLC
jgi:hypothetical protein